jgi:hypothetical protein
MQAQAVAAENLRKLKSKAEQSAELPSAHGADGAQNFPGLPVSASVQNAIELDGLPPFAAPFGGSVDPERRHRVVPQLQRVVTSRAGDRDESDGG